MKILAVETSTLVGSIALIEDGQLLTEHQIEIKTTYSDSLFPLIDRALQNVSISIHEIDGYATAIGPGSFTALRIGLSVIKGLALAAGKPMVGIPSLDGLANNLCFNDLMICPILNARRGEVYTAFYKRGNGHVLKKLTPDRVVNPQILLNEIGGEIIFLGDGIKLYRFQITRKVKKCVFLDESTWYPRANNLIQASLNLIRKKTFVDINKLKPIYLYPKECQISNENRRKK